MKKVTHEKIYDHVKPSQVWKVWTDVNQWHQWDLDIEYAKMTEEFKVGASFDLKPKNGPKVKIRLTRVLQNRGYTDVTSFPLAKMYGVHDLEPIGEGVKLKTSIEMTGPLRWLWWKTVGQGVAASLGEQDDTLVEVARNRP